jgi:hypothetical protein
MRLLLDTNVLTWLHHRPERLGKRTKARISDATIVYYSPLSFFEWLQRDDFQGINAKPRPTGCTDLGPGELPISRFLHLGPKDFGSSPEFCEGLDSLGPQLVATECLKH